MEESRDAGNKPKAPDSTGRESNTFRTPTSMQFGSRDRDRDKEEFTIRQEADAGSPHRRNKQVADRPAVLALPSASILKIRDPTADQIDRAVQFGVSLQAAHDGEYIDFCHATRFKHDRIYDKSEGKLPRAILEVFPQQVQCWIDHFAKNKQERDQLLKSLDIEATEAPPLEDLALTCESFIFPPVFANPLFIKILPPIYSSDLHMSNAQKMLDHCA